MPRILEEVRKYCQYNLKYQTLLRWFQNFLKFGEVPARHGVGTSVLRATRGRRVTSFTANDKAELDRIIEFKPYVYLDEIQAELCRTCNGKVWHSTTIGGS